MVLDQAAAEVSSDKQLREEIDAVLDEAWRQS